MDYKSKGLRLLKKGQRGIVHTIFSRLGLIILLFALQVLMLLSMFQKFQAFLPHMLGAIVLFIVGMVIYLLNSKINPTAKITWLIVIMLLPLFGVLLFLYTKLDIGNRALKARVGQIVAKTKESIPQSEEVMARLLEENQGVAALAHYMQRSG